MSNPEHDNKRLYIGETNDGTYAETNNQILSKESDLVRSLSEGEHAAYDQLFLQYYDKVLGFACSLVKQREEAEDLVEDVFVRLWTNREQLDATKSFQSFLYTNTRNAVFNHLRDQKVRDNYRNNLSEPGLWETPQTDEEFIARETELLIKLTVSKMPTQRRKVFELKHNKGMSNAEIAEELGISRKAVEKHMRLALADIRNVITAFLTFIYLS